MKVELNNICYSINRNSILDNVNITIKAGDKLAICGPNGAGKSTLLNIILNLPIAGFRRRTHMVSGEIYNDLFSTHTYDNVKIHLQKSNFSYNFYLRVGELLDLCFEGKIPMDLVRGFHLEHKLNNLVMNLSGGEYQKLNIILTIGTNPKVLFIDEITTGLDYESKKKIIAAIKDYTSGEDKTLVFVTHYLDEVRELANKIVFMNQGRIVASGGLKQLLQEHHLGDMDVEGLYEEVIIHNAENL